MADSLLQKCRYAWCQASKTMSLQAFLAVLPAIVLLLYWVAGETAMVLAAVLAPFILLLIVARKNRALAATFRNSAVQGLIKPDGFDAITRQNFQKVSDEGLRSAVFSFEIDHLDALTKLHGKTAAEEVVGKIGIRLVGALRDQDAITQSGKASFAVCLEPTPHLDLEQCIQLACRLQSTMDDPVVLNGKPIYLTGCIGFAQQTEDSAFTAKSWREASDIALRHAQRHGAGTIRAFTKEIRQHTALRSDLGADVATALSEGQIEAWFQPQISTDTGRVTGFEALARWQHPKKGLVAPIDFLPLVEELGLLERLAEVMMVQALKALKAWDAAGLKVPQVGVKFAGPELNNPKLVDKIKWKLDRFDLKPERLAVEVLETVVANTPNDVVTRNILKLGELGCKIDLDDFGTGNTSIASIRRFSVNRIKIDRSFVRRADRDPEQQRLISAVLTLAERLDVQTLAEGVETAGEHALLAQLGCDHVQGFGIARPMPFEQTVDWLTKHNAKLQTTAQIVGNKLR